MLEMGAQSLNLNLGFVGKVHHHFQVDTHCAMTVDNSEF